MFCGNYPETSSATGMVPIGQWQIVPDQGNHVSAIRQDWHILLDQQGSLAPCSHNNGGSYWIPQPLHQSTDSSTHKSQSRTYPPPARIHTAHHLRKLSMRHRICSCGMATHSLCSSWMRWLNFWLKRFQLMNVQRRQCAVNLRRLVLWRSIRFWVEPWKAPFTLGVII
jgi:hypothetical protein